MAQFNGLWLPMSDSTNASPSEFDMHKIVNSQLVQAARMNKTFVSRLVRNATPMHMGGGVINKTVDFTVTGGIGTETHLKNDRFTGMNMNQIQRQIQIDERPRRTGIEEENITRMFEQVNVRNDVLARLGNALASWDEVECLKALVDASQYTTAGSENTTEFLEGGNAILTAANTSDWSNLSTANAGATKALEILDKLEDIAIAWDEVGVPMEGRNVILPIQDVVEIVKLEKAYTGATSIAGGIYGNVDIVGDKIPFTRFVNGESPIMYRDFNIWSHALMKATYDIHTQGLQTLHTLDPNHNSRGSSYTSGGSVAGDLTKVQAIVFQQEAIGKTDVMSVMIDQGPVPMSTNEYINAMTWVGYGTLRPEAAVVLDIA